MDRSRFVAPSLFREQLGRAHCRAQLIHLRLYLLRERDGVVKVGPGCFRRPCLARVERSANAIEEDAALRRGSIQLITMCGAFMSTCSRLLTD